MAFRVPESCRVTKLNGGHAEHCSTAADGNNGVFVFSRGEGNTKRVYNCIVSDKLGWEHVSIHIRLASDNYKRPHTPNWTDMCYVKSKFWDEEDVVMQLHPAESDYVSYHNQCLHLWRPVEAVIPKPPYWMVGPKPGQSAEEFRQVCDEGVREYEDRHLQV